MTVCLIAKYDLTDYRSRIICECYEDVFHGYHVYSSLKDLRNYDTFLISRLDWYLFEYFVIRIMNPSAKIYYVAFEEVTICPLHDFNFGLNQLFDGCAYWDRSYNQNGYEVFNIPQIKDSDELPEVVTRRSQSYISIYSFKTSTAKTSLYDIRIKVHNILVEKFGGVFYGWGWSKAKVLPFNYCGELSSKDVMANYKFAAAIENTYGQKGNVTEKFFDAVYWGCIPVVWGSSPKDIGIPDNIYLDISDLNFEKFSMDYVNEHDLQKFRREKLKFVFGQEQFCRALSSMLNSSSPRRESIWRTKLTLFRTILFSKAHSSYLSAFKYALKVLYLNSLRKMR